MRKANKIVYIILSVIVVISIILTSCEDDPSPQQDSNISDGVLRSDGPRLGLTNEKLTALKTKTGSQQWTDLLNRMTSSLSSGQPDYGFGAFHFAVAFAVTDDERFADMAKDIVFKIIDQPGYCDVTSSFLRAPDCTGQVALAADILMERLSGAEKTKIFDYLEKNARDIVEVNAWSGWGWVEGNPAFRQLNNYYPGHLQTILHYALLAYDERELAKEYYRLVVEKELPDALELMKEELAGGHGAEGTWYDDKLMGHYAEVILMLREATEGRVDFGKEYAQVFSDYVKFRLFSFQPILEENGKPQLYYLPTGDQPAVREAKALDLSRLRLWLLMDVLKDTEEKKAAEYIRYFEQHVNFESKGWQREFQLYYLLHFDATVSATSYDEMGNVHFSAGKGVAQYRTGWGNNDMTASIHFSPSQGQRNSHWHFGEGAFYVWYKGWQADHLNRVEGNGIRQNTALMNTLLVNNDQNSQGSGNATVTAFKGGNKFMAVRGSLTSLYKNKLDKFDRTFMVTGKMISVHDDVVKKSTGDVINFQINAANGFTASGSSHVSSNQQGQLVVKAIVPGGSASTLDRGLRIDYASASAEVNMLHAIQVQNPGESFATTLPIENIQSNAGSFVGVQFLPSGRSYVHISNRTSTKANTVTYSAPFGAGPVEHLIMGLSEGNYIVRRDGNQITTVQVGNDGVLYFESASGGTFSVSQ